jgi:hypothetical protein
MELSSSSWSSKGSFCSYDGRLYLETRESMMAVSEKEVISSFIDLWLFALELVLWECLES